MTPKNDEANVPMQSNNNTGNKPCCKCSTSWWLVLDEGGDTSPFVELKCVNVSKHTKCDTNFSCLHQSQINESKSFPPGYSTSRWGTGVGHRHGIQIISQQLTSNK
eukprot:CAMPEP_0174309568 /NCGR_PEP_ID=MMETSP0810-20121108/2492_1 /TAXON_ID=73025 ORGANISM="Eutreptiella gymnastica-like, Strain CCMP1594" /NCGR_SAMPLE_ID=MMETSP0810 /ASSEMBLY_ACC=CAM_ASM_000659 /LENGTH=105 /DNA_ID=CAMNT_0015417235 /DNA_START=901 /DNA_END=1218 /DNA_ORIENTATION=-